MSQPPSPIRISFGGTCAGKTTTTEVPLGTSVLAASLAAKIPMASVCGGRGRCSACRVRIIEGGEEQPSPDAVELATLRPLLKRDPSLRLACRLRPHADITVAPLMSTEQTDQSPDLAGRMVQATVMFVDVRGFSRMAAKKHPFDVVFTLNRFFDIVAEAVHESGGRIDKFIGDGVMALFGLDDTTEDHGARSAIQAARLLSRKLQDLNQAFIAESSDPLKIGIGLHCGPVIWGKFGWGSRDEDIPETAIGDAVNITSRLEDMTKKLGCQLVVSHSVAQWNAHVTASYPEQTIIVPNHDGHIRIHAITDAAELPNH